LLKEPASHGTVRRSLGVNVGILALVSWFMAGSMLVCCGCPILVSVISSVSLPSYDVVHVDKSDTPNKTQIIFHAVVSGTVTERGLRRLLYNLYDEAKSSSGFKYHRGRPTHVGIFLYTSREHFQSGMGQYIARLVRIGEGGRVEVEVATNSIAELNTNPEIKHGLSEASRIEIWRARVLAEDRAEVEARRLYPQPSTNQFTTQRMLEDKYARELAEQYGITVSELDEISVEAHTKNWPFPP